MLHSSIPLLRPRLLLGPLAIVALAIPLFAAPPSAAPQSAAPLSGAQPETETLYLSGTGPADTVPWEFRCEEGRGCGEWTTIPVPSQWELQGFGAYNYGHDEDKARDRGLYRHRFRAPESWSGRRIDLVFEGVMTDATVRLNGEPVGTTHRGGFYRFRYPVTGRVRLGAENLLEVEVAEHSAEPSVNRAEREADYWVFGGIYRPVYLEARPPESVRRVAVDARHDGRLRVTAFSEGLNSPARLAARVLDREGRPLGEAFAAEVSPGDPVAELSAHLQGVDPWSSESPALYRLEVRLERRGTTLHRIEERIGFRTVEVRSGKGLFLNGRRLLLKGVNRHSFRPDSGRTLSPRQNRLDAELIKRLNMNAVRTSHYPPDKAFLEACDELGLYVIDELAGWHDAYSTSVGEPLVRAMVERDANHPSVILWANGNEGGWNTDLDPLFHRHDPQRRAVLHPDSGFSGFDTGHYPSWAEMAERLDPASWLNRIGRLLERRRLVMPTEMLHGLYGGGSGAGLESFWELMRGSPLAAGGFLWSFSDEAVVRTDRRGELDAAGNYAPDGILGPYREWTANADAVRAIWSPVALIRPAPGRPPKDRVELENRWESTDLGQSRFRWRLLEVAPPTAPAPHRREIDSGEISGPAAAPGERALLSLPLPPNGEAGLLILEALDPEGREVHSWGLPLLERRAAVAGWTRSGDAEEVFLDESGGELVARSADLELGWELALDRSSGRLLRLGLADRPPLLTGGPTPEGSGRQVVDRLEVRRGNGSVEVEAHGDDGLRLLHWRVLPSGWLRLAFAYEDDGEGALSGLGFDLDPARVERLRWLGDGPGPRWSNRMAGGRFDLWEREAREFEGGFLSGVRWLQLEIGDSRLTLVPESEGLFVSVFPPRFPADARNAVAELPSRPLALLHSISPMGSKFVAGRELAPPGDRGPGPGLRRGVVWLRVDRPSSTAKGDSQAAVAIADRNQ